MLKENVVVRLFSRRIFEEAIFFMSIPTIKYCTSILNDAILKMLNIFMSNN